MRHPRRRRPGPLTQRCRLVRGRLSLRVRLVDQVLERRAGQAVAGELVGPGRLDHLAERRPGEIRHGEVEQVSLGPRGVDRHDVRVVQPGQGPPLAVEPQEQAFAGRLASQGLDRHMPAQWLLDGLVDLSHPPAADRPDHPVGPEPLRVRGFVLSGLRLAGVARRGRPKQRHRFGQLLKRLRQLREPLLEALQDGLGIGGLEQLLLELLEGFREGAFGLGGSCGFMAGLPREAGRPGE